MASQPAGSTLRYPHFWLRLVLLAFAITAFAVIAEYLDKQLDDTTQARLAYTTFVGVATSVACLLFMTLYLAGLQWNFALRVNALVVDVLGIVFWGICAGVLTNSVVAGTGLSSSDLDTLRSYCSRRPTASGCAELAAINEAYSRLQAACAFAYLSWFVVTVLAIMFFYDRSRLKLAEAAATPTVAAPSMVYMVPQQPYQQGAPLPGQAGYAAGFTFGAAVPAGAAAPPAPQQVAAPPRPAGYPVADGV